MEKTNMKKEGYMKIVSNQSKKQSNPNGLGDSSRLCNLRVHSLSLCIGACAVFFAQVSLAQAQDVHSAGKLGLSGAGVVNVQAGIAQTAGAFAPVVSNKINKVFELSASEGVPYCTTLNKTIKDLPKYTFDISSIITMLKAPCVEHQQALSRLKEQQSQMSGSLGPINGLSLIASSAPQGALELATFYSHLFSNVFTVDENTPKVDQSDLILYQSLYKKLKLHTTDVLLKDLAHVYVVREAISSLKPERKTTVGKLNDLKTIKDLGVIADQMEQYMSSYHARLAVNHMRLSYALENLEQFESVRQNFDSLIPMILESSDSQNPFYNKTLKKSQCSFMQSYAPGSWENQRNSLQIKCE